MEIIQPLIEAIVELVQNVELTHLKIVTEDVNYIRYNV